MCRTSETVRGGQLTGHIHADPPEELGELRGDFTSKPGEHATSALLAPAPDGRPVLTDCHQSIPMQDRTTFPSERFPNSVIDFILTSPAMSARLIPGSATIFSDPQLTKGSDHLPVVAEFDMSGNGSH